MVKVKKSYLLCLLLLAAALFAINGCAPKTSGAVRDDSSLTGISDKLAPTGDYTGPKLRMRL